MQQRQRQSAGPGKGERVMIEAMKTLAGKKDVCVLATASGEGLHCSLMAYATDEKLLKRSPCTRTLTGRSKA